MLVGANARDHGGVVVGQVTVGLIAVMGPLGPLMPFAISLRSVGMGSLGSSRAKAGKPSSEMTMTLGWLVLGGGG